ncbi:MAG: hypothetical protein RI911_749 [Candidatus Parcubacteria bacterium]|jgi:hypothetical protein
MPEDMKDPQTHLIDRLRTCAMYQPAGTILTDEALRDELRKLVLRKPYRKWKAQARFLERLEYALTHSLTHHEPLRFRLWFGGYKLWRFTTAPTVDWAEFFMLAYYLEYLAPIAALHPHGVELVFSSDEVFVERLNNIPQKDTEAYTHSFKQLITYFQQYHGTHISIQYRLNRHELGDEASFEKGFQAAVEQIRPIWTSQRTPEQLEKDLSSSWLNIRFSGGSTELSHLSEDQRRVKALESLLLHDALGVFENKILTDDHPEYISIFPTGEFADTLGLGTTKNSMAKFWVGTGVLERHSDGHFSERILTWKQYSALEKGTFDILDVSGVLPEKQFNEIIVLHQPLSF